MACDNERDNELSDTKAKLREAIDSNADPNVIEELLWNTLTAFQSTEFHTFKGLSFTYAIKGNEMFVSRKEKTITRASVALSLKRVLELHRSGTPITGPKKIGTFGASYLYPIFDYFGIIK